MRKRRVYVERSDKQVCSDASRERCEQIALYMLENNATVRSAASHFGISKSTVHKDVTGTLKKYNHRLYLEIKELLDINKAERHMRGGEATRKKYSEIKLEQERAKMIKKAI